MPLRLPVSSRKKENEVSVQIVEPSLHVSSSSTVRTIDVSFEPLSTESKSSVKALMATSFDAGVRASEIVCDMASSIVKPLILDTDGLMKVKRRSRSMVKMMSLALVVRSR